MIKVKKVIEIHCTLCGYIGIVADKTAEEFWSGRKCPACNDGRLKKWTGKRKKVNHD